MYEKTQNSYEIPRPILLYIYDLDFQFFLKICRDLPTKIWTFNTFKHVSCVLISDNGKGGIKPTWYFINNIYSYYISYYILLYIIYYTKGATTVCFYESRLCRPIGYGRPKIVLLSTDQSRSTCWPLLIHTRDKYIYRNKKNLHIKKFT